MTNVQSRDQDRYRYQSVLENLDRDLEDVKVQASSVEVEQDRKEKERVQQFNYLCKLKEIQRKRLAKEGKLSDTDSDDPYYYEQEMNTL